MNRPSWILALLSGTVALAGCGSPAAPSAGPLAAGRPQTSAAAQPSVSADAPAGSQAGYGLSAVNYTPSDRIIFHSNQGAFGIGLPGFPSNQNSDIYLYDPRNGQVSALGGINTPDPELNARISDNGRWVVFQRTTGGAHQEILMFDTRTQTLDDLQGLNGEGGDAYMPDISNDAQYIVYVQRTGSTGRPQLRLFNNADDRNTLLPVTSSSFRDITWPTISGDGRRIAFGASSLPPLGTARDFTGSPSGGGAVSGLPASILGSDIYIYDLNGGRPTLIGQSAVNTTASEYNPDLSCDGQHMLFVSNRLGQEDIFEANLAENYVDTLPLLNNIPNFAVSQADALLAPLADKQHPRYVGESHDRILFQIKPAGPVTTGPGLQPTAPWPAMPSALPGLPGLPVLPTGQAGGAAPALQTLLAGLAPGATALPTPTPTPTPHFSITSTGAGTLPGFLAPYLPQAGSTPASNTLAGLPTVGAALPTAASYGCVCPDDTTATPPPTSTSGSGSTSTTTSSTFPVQLRVYDRTNGQLDMLSGANSILYGSGLRSPQSELLP